MFEVAYLLTFGTNLSWGSFRPGRKYFLKKRIIWKRQASIRAQRCGATRFRRAADKSAPLPELSFNNSRLKNTGKICCTVFFFLSSPCHVLSSLSLFICWCCCHPSPAPEPLKRLGIAATVSWNEHGRALVTSPLTGTGGALRGAAHE